MVCASKVITTQPRKASQDDAMPDPVHAVGPKHLTSNRADFGKLPEKLQKLGYAVVALDLRGYGKREM